MALPDDPKTTHADDEDLQAARAALAEAAQQGTVTLTQLKAELDLE